VDGVISWTTSKPAFAKALASAGKTLKVMPWSDVGFDGYGLAVIASDKLISGKPDVVARFTKAYLAAPQAALRNPDDVAKAMKSAFPEMDEALVRDQFLTLPPQMDHPINQKNGLALSTRRSYAHMGMDGEGAELAARQT
jgi:NitT/TauT family transport system substrate-binding protein